MGNMKANKKFVEAEEAVSAVIGVILMVAITVAIAATVYVYVSGIIGPGTASTPSVSITANPSGTGCTITVASPTANDIEWGDTWFTLSNTTDQLEANTIVWPAGMTWPSRAAGSYIKGGQAIYIATNYLSDGDAYTLTLVYNDTGGTMGSVSWTQ